jgi:uncharacterized membrane protein YsdA (DUF1294 family)
MQKLIYAAGLVCLAMSFALLVTMGTDKKLAQIGARRVPERRLFLMALLFGAPGGLLGMYAFRHKTKHWYFVAGFWALTLLQLGVLSYLAYRFM